MLLLADAEGRVDTQREKIQEHSVFLGQLQDSHTSIHHLPPEILVDIFICVATYRDNRRTFWKSLAHICHQWRTLALSISTLWCNIPLCDPTVSKEFLERCKCGPLHIYMSREDYITMSPQDVETWRELLELHMSRTRTISLHAGQEQRLQLWLWCFQGPFTSLERLSLSSYSKTHIPWAEGVAEPFPVLRHVKLSRVTVPWTSQIFNNLQRLELLYQFFTGCKITMKQFLVVLERCSHSLETLKIEYSGPGLPSRASPTPIGHHINLSKLQTFELRHYATVINQLLARVSFPHTARLKIRYQARSSAPLEIRFPGRDTAFSHLTDSARIHLRVDESSVRLNSDNLDLSASLHADFLSRTYPYFLSQILSHFRTPNTVEEIAIHCVWPVVVLKDDWFQALSSFTGLKTLSFSQTQKENTWSSFELCDALAKRRDEGSILCPQLQNLTLRGVCFTTSSLRVLAYEGPNRDVASELANCLRERARRGSRLSLLKLRYVNALAQATIPVLEEVVDRLEWSLST